MEISSVIGTLLAFLVGAGIVYFIFNRKSAAEKAERVNRADEIIEKAKKDANEIKYNARKESKEIVSDGKEQLEKESKRHHNDIKNLEKDVAKKEATLEAKLEEQDIVKKRLQTQEEDLVNSKKNVEREAERYRTKQGDLSDKLSEVAGMTKDEAKGILLENMEETAKVEFAKELRRLEEETKEDAEKLSKRVIGIAIQRFAGEYVSEKTISSVELPSDDVKGRLIGREGRNIRAFEQICGVILLLMILQRLWLFLLLMLLEKKSPD